MGGELMRRCTSLAPGLEEHPHQRPGGVASHDRVVHHHQPLVLEGRGERVELHADAQLAHLVVGVDEGTADVAVLDQGLAVGDAAAGRVADGGGIAGVGHGDHQVGLHRRLCRQLLTHAAAGGIERLPLHHRVGAGEVDELEDAQRLALARHHLLYLVSVLAEHADLARFDLPHQTARR